MGKQRQKDRRDAVENIAVGAVSTVFNIVLVIVVAMVIYRCSVSAYQYGVRIFGEPPVSGVPGREVDVTIVDGMDFKGIAKQIYEKGLVRDERLLHIQELLSNYSKDGFAAGTYTLSTAMTAEEMMDVMAGLGEDDDDS